MKNPLWFKPLGWLYRPVTLTGWILTLITVLLIVRIFLVIDRQSHSVSDTLTGVFPWAWIFLVTLGWVASKTSARRG